MTTLTNIRPSPIAGQWYPADALSLAAMVDGYIQAAQIPALPGEVVAVVAPHAGHLYSGPVAGYAFATLKNFEPELVAVVSPMHYPYSQPLLTSAHDAYQTPLGPIPIDQEAVNTLDLQLRTGFDLELTPVEQDPEHSLEIELPFLQRALKNEFSLLPVMVRDQTRATAHSLGTALANTLRDRQALMVASTDLSHFYPQQIAEALDAEMLQQLEAFDPDGIFRVEEQGKGFACGRAALAGVLWGAKALGADRVQVLHHATSGDVTGDYSRVVGYGAAVITRKTTSG
jgi:AmmeMemoRadiSam system protein B